MALDVEGVIGGCVGGEKSLRGSHALDPLHLPLPSSGWLMRILRSIVAPSATLVAFCDSKMTGCGGIRSQLICDDLVGTKPYFFSSLRINLSAARLFLLVWTSTSRTSTSASTERHR